MRKVWMLGVSLGLTLGFVAGVEGQSDKNPATTPSVRMAKDGKADPGWGKKHEQFVATAKKGDVDVLFLGDSITAGWNGAGKKVWDANFAPMKAANFGIGGDRTQHVLWRIQNGELEGIAPKAAVLMIGTNNSGSDSPEQIAAGVSAIVKTLGEKAPKTKVLLLAVFPRSAKGSDAIRAKLADVNARIAKLDDGSRVKYLDIGQKFLEADGTLTKEVMPDLLHLSPRGYQIWADAILPTLRELAK